MINPHEVFRTNAEGYFFETAQEAHEQSVSDAGHKLFLLLKDSEKHYSKNGAEIIGVEPEVRAAIKELLAAFSGKSFTKYKISK